MNIESNLAMFAEDEGRDAAMRAAEQAKRALELLAELGSKDERAAALLLIERIDAGIYRILGIPKPASA